MKKPFRALLQRRYQRLKTALSRVDLICRGTVLARYDPRRPNAMAPYYQWTRKRNNKTLSVALSKEQYQRLRQAITNHRKLEQTLRQMRVLSEKMIFQTIPGIKKRNILKRKVLRAN